VGKPPFDDDEAVVVMARHIKHAPKPPREAAPDVPIPTALERIILRALAKDPRDRPPAAETFIRALDRIELPVDEDGTISLDADVAGDGDEDPFPTMAPPPVRARGWLVGALAGGAMTVLLGVGLFVGWRMTQHDTTAAASGSVSGPPMTSSTPSGSAAASSGPPETVAIDQLPVVGGGGPGAGATTVRVAPKGPKTPVGGAAPPATPATATATAPPKPTGGYERFE